MTRFSGLNLAVLAFAATISFSTAALAGMSSEKKADAKAGAKSLTEQDVNSILDTSTCNCNSLTSENLSSVTPPVELNSQKTQSSATSAPHDPLSEASPVAQGKIQASYAEEADAPATSALTETESDKTAQAANHSSEVNQEKLSEASYEKPSDAATETTANQSSEVKQEKISETAHKKSTSSASSGTSETSSSTTEQTPTAKDESTVMKAQATAQETVENAKTLTSSTAQQMQATNSSIENTSEAEASSVTAKVER